MTKDSGNTLSSFGFRNSRHSTFVFVIGRSCMIAMKDNLGSEFVERIAASLRERRPFESKEFRVRPERRRWQLASRKRWRKNSI